ncbi:MAG: MFS transporter [Sphingomonas sp.]|nr:MFS transporter [Sphingomonas sp.]
MPIVPASSPTNWRAYGVVFASTIGNMLSVTPAVTAVFGIFLIAIAGEFGWPRAEVGGALAVLSLSTAFASPIAGRLADRFGTRRTLLAGSLGLGVTIMALALAPNQPVIFYAQFALVGVVGALPNGMVFAKLIAEWFDERRGLWIGIAGGIGNGIGATILPIIAGLLFEWVGWRGAFVGIGLLILVIGLPILFLFVHDPIVRSGADGVEPQYEGVELRTALGSPTFWLIASAMPVGAGSLIALFSTVIPVLTDRGFSLDSATIVLIAFALTASAWEPSVGAILDRTRRPHILAAFHWIGAGGLIVLLTATTLPLLVVAGMMLGIGLGAETSAMSFLLSRYFGRRALGAISGWAFGLLLGITALTTVLLNLVYDHTTSYLLGIEAMVPLLAWNGLVMLLLGRYRYGAVPA